MSIAVQIENRREDILRLAAQHSAGNVLLFGSVARGDDTAESDLDSLSPLIREFVLREAAPL